MAIVSAIHHAASLNIPPRQILIFTDSLDCVYVFDSLRVAEAIHNAPLLAASSIVARTGIDICIQHIDGTHNIRADPLSRLLFADYSAKFPADRVCIFLPPRELLPVRWRDCF